MTGWWSSRPEDDDDGLSLIELIVGLLVSTLVLVGVGSVLVSAWLTQSDVTTTSQATTRGQVIGSAIERAVRNAITFDVSADGTTLRVSTTLAGASACQGFRFVADGDGALLWSTSSSALTAEPWPVWQSGVVRGAADEGSPVPVFRLTGAGNAVAYTFDIETDAAPVRFVGEVVMRSSATETSTSCW